MLRRKIIFCFCILQALVIIHASRFVESPSARISKSQGDNVNLKWRHTVYKPSELVRLECGYLNASRQMTKLMEQFPSEVQPRTTVIGTRFQNRAYIKDGALVLTNLRAADTGIYFCIMKVYDSQNFRTVTVRSPDSYLSVGGPDSGERSGMSSGTRTTIIAIIVVVVILVIALFAFFYFRKRDRNKKKRIPTNYDEEDSRNGNTKFLGSAPSQDKKDLSGKQALTTADIEVVSSPMEAVNRVKGDRSYSSHQAYETVPAKDKDLKGERTDSWPQPPTPTKTTADQPLERMSPKTNPPSRTPPRVLPKPPVHRKVSEDMFV